MFTRIFGFLAVFCVSLLPLAPAVADDEMSPWHTTLGAGTVAYETDEEYYSTLLTELRLGYRVDPAVTVEGGVGLLPHLNKRNFDDGRFEADGDGFGVKFTLDGLYHLDDSEDREIDPFLAAGVGGILYDESLESGSFDPFVALGGGVGYNIDRNWFVRGDYRVAVAGHDTEFNQHALLSIGYRFGKDFGRGGSQTGGEDGALTTGDRTTLSPVYFAFDSSRMDEMAQETSKKNADWLRQNNANVVIEGHCDERGTTEYNMALGQRRADSVLEYLRSLGVPVSTMSTVSYGEERPADVGHDETAWSKNRRAEFVVK